MTVVPVERAGMASGVSGTMRFSGIVIGFAALGAILFHRIASDLGRALHGVDTGERIEIAHLIANGNIGSAEAALISHGAVAEIARQSLAHGYTILILTASVVGFVAAAVSWILIDPAETPAHPKLSVPVPMEVSID
jgi:hypothetical protein